jgi:ferredoxin
MDIAACEIVGYPPKEIPVNREALSRGIWLNDIGEIEYPAVKPWEAALPDFEKIPLKKTGSQLADFLLPRFVRKFRERLAPRPSVNPAVCIRCGDCTRICGSKAMSLVGEGKEKHVVINYRSCIRCYCCHEICPVKAIEIKKAPLRQR